MTRGLDCRLRARGGRTIKRSEDSSPKIPPREFPFAQSRYIPDSPLVDGRVVKSLEGVTIKVRKGAYGGQGQVRPQLGTWSQPSGRKTSREDLRRAVLSQSRVRVAAFSPAP